jgi:TolB-like protein
LLTLLRAPGQVLSKADLMRAAWLDATVEESNLSVQIAALRKQLGPSPDGGDWIATIPRVGYRFIGSVAAQRDTDGGNAPRIKGEARPSIAVLPFINLGGDREQEYLADGVTEDIITALTRFRWFLVIARNSSFAYKDKSLDVKQVARELGVRYLLEGSLRKSGQRVRISAQLVDATSGSHIWAERYDLELTELFAIQDDRRARCWRHRAGAAQDEGAQAVARHTGNMTAWDRYVAAPGISIR